MEISMNEKNKVMFVIIAIVSLTFMGWLAPEVIVFFGIVVKSLIWPLFFIVLFFMYGEELLPVLKKKIGDVKHVSKSGMTFSQDEKKDTKIEIKVDEDDKSELYRKRKKILKKRIDEIAGKDQEKIIETLFNDCVYLDLQVSFERLNSVIYKSQVDMLKSISVLKNPVVKGYIETFYIPVKKYYRKDYSFDKWLQWLISSDVIEEVKGEAYKATEFGISFFNFLENQNLDDMERIP